MTANIKSIIGQPCGMVEVAEFVTTTGRSFQIESLMLPLAVDQRRSPRLCTISVMMYPFDDPDDAYPRFKSNRQAEWIGIDFGVPQANPQYPA